ncbi:tellurite resistance/C4-dicarboxylate transporter family protein [Neoroseomonas lacus]|uniref:C4-dicarboxylate transporter n=1 Tax=Neoroseomonas lacus TaxID=287609 RepID=A0A917L1E0_9PROT|nr:tellurite resistance/C4-dicarboxylate transporter family protein [Neoroseomonas lacus]GGJ40352.1 C4-dicarboxylate transporter [Neoroseomonas lacus]
MTTLTHATPTSSAFRILIGETARDLFPGYFALVMATGVVSIACHLLGLRLIAQPLVGIAWTAYLVLWGLTLARLVLFPRRIVEDLSNHQRAPGFFTVVASTCVLGTQTSVVTGAQGVAAWLWYFGLGLWFVVMYAFFTAVMIRARKPTLAAGINGVWLIAAVATQSIVVLRGTLGAAVPPPEVQFICLAFFMIGCMLYLAIIPLIFYRLTFVRLSALDFGPPYWINMGAVAISTLAGSILLLRSPTWPLLADFVPFLRGFTLFFWAAATWWIPLLFALTLWRYLVRREPLRYEPTLWGMVFPLGMYTTGTLQLSRALDLPFLTVVPGVFIHLAVLAWGLTFLGLLGRIGGTLLRACRRR